MVTCPNCGRRTSGDYCQYCKYPILKGGAFRSIKEKLRDKTRDNICASLRALGVAASMAERGKPEEKISSGSLGLIDIAKGPIRWVNVCKVTSGGQYSASVTYYTDYGVPDSRIGSSFPKIRINSVRVKTFPVFGHVIDLRWKGNDLDLGIVGRLNSDSSIKDTIMKCQDLTIHARADHGCWIIYVQTDKAPSEELWNCYQNIAHHLLADWSTS